MRYVEINVHGGLEENTRSPFLFGSVHSCEQNEQNVQKEFYKH